MAVESGSVVCGSVCCVSTVQSHVCPKGQLAAAALVDGDSLWVSALHPQNFSLQAACHKTCLVVLGAAAAAVLRAPWTGLPSRRVPGAAPAWCWGAGARHTCALSVKVLESKHHEESKEKKKLLKNSMR